MKSLHERLTNINEAKIQINTLAQPKNIKYDLTPGYSESGFPGIIIGKPFKYNDDKGDSAAKELIEKFELKLGNDYDFWISDIEEQYGKDAKKLWFCYFLNNENYEVDCYVFGADGVYALM